MKIDIYNIRALTNMHVGSGDVNFDIIDNQVQRDVVSKFPTINSSSLKGALREHFDSKEGFASVVEIFGGKKEKEKDNITGTHRFFSGNLLSYPVRSNKRPFFRATCPMIIEEFISTLDNFSLEYDLKDELEEFGNLFDESFDESDEEKVLVFEESLDGAVIEDKEAEYNDFSEVKALEGLFGENIVLYSNEDFKDLMDELPVIARNKLENGESKNLWYEEVVARESRFYCVIIDSSKNDNNDFEKALESDIIQIGANASIGYGYTKFNKIVGGSNG
ncbi:type III-B CRISPR module RAMP protein Cmr4 [Halonatronum saccharophilum]|uniref:type III-B CRISPR module RAMP protein Cmr4 n=1 Tax=Halonatronum saccharophilum TaxID=150060 RepID=UPI0004854F7A|nr:type III-B CRISPR module RAMP protein Cmr4 [Halonatronum saccharophilum]